MEQHEVIIIGGGHNGLVLAAYLARAGIDVLVLEASDQVGGGVSTRERVAPGFHCDTHASVHILVLANPLIAADELGLLSRYGLEYLRPDLITVMPLPDGGSVAIHKDLDATVDSIAAVSPADAQAYRALVEQNAPALDIALAGLFSPPAPLAEMVAAVEASPGGAGAVSAMMMSARDVIEPAFQSDALRAFLTKWCSEFMQSPWQAGTARFMAMLPLYHRFGIALPVGGSAALCDALVRCIEDHNGLVRSAAPVESIVFAQGKASGVSLVGGEQVAAHRAVVATVNAKQLYGPLLGDALPPELARAAAGLRHSEFVRFKLHAALDRLPQSTIGDSAFLAGSFERVNGYRELLAGFQRITSGWLADTPLGTGGFPTALDPSRAPEGRHLLWYEGYLPMQAPEGGWARHRETLAEQTLDYLEPVFPDLRQRVTGWELDTPADMEAGDSSFIGGDIMHIRDDLSQSGQFRPLPGLPPYHTPFDGLYLCGPSTHPGGGVSGGSRAAARVLLEQLGCDPARVMG